MANNGAEKWSRNNHVLQPSNAEEHLAEPRSRWAAAADDHTWYGSWEHHNLSIDAYRVHPAG